MLEDIIGGKVQIDKYGGSEFEISDWDIKDVLDDILLVRFIDGSSTGTEVIRNGIAIPINAVSHVWRVGEVVKAGPKCVHVKVGDIVVFPNDKGIKAAEINGIKNVVFLNESRVFGTAVPKYNKPEARKKK